MGICISRFGASLDNYYKNIGKSCHQYANYKQLKQGKGKKGHTLPVQWNTDMG